MASTIKYSNLLTVLAVLFLFSARVHAFGAGNIQSNAKVEGLNFRHGDIEDTLLTLLTARALGGKKFSKLDVKRVYFGNWLRDYSQAIDVGTVKSVSAEAIRILLWVLGFMSFGYGTGEFEVTRDRLGCYRPEEHIDNPKDYADNLDARKYDRRLRGPVDERRELGIDPHTGLKNYIASENLGITTSAGLVRNLFGRCIELGRQYKRSKNDRDYYEALRLLGTANHCLEDYSAHSNYVELALIELGERDVFPHVGRRTQVQLQGARHPVYPIVTGTFGGVDFLHSVCGELSDKTTQSELQDLEGTLQQSQQADTSLLKDLLGKLPPGLLGDNDQADKADQLQANATAASMQNMNISPKEPEAFTQQINELVKQIYPILEFHDNIIKNISETIDKIPVLPELVEQIQTQISLFVFQLLGPLVIPIIHQVKNELSTGSEEIINSSRDKQLIVFRDDSSSDPTHSMLSKDHFSSVLNEPAGRIGCAVLTWVVPQIVACWDDDRLDIGQTVDRIINGVFHHPALRQSGDAGARDGRMMMFAIVEQWWSQQSERERADLRDKLSRDGVEHGRNHKEGVHDSGHGCGKPLGLPNMKTSSSSGAPGGPAAAVLGGLNQVLSGGSSSNSGNQASSQIGNSVGDALGGGALGSIVGGLAGGLLGNAFGGSSSSETKTYQSSEYNQDGSYTSHVTETGHRPGRQGQSERYGQAELSTTSCPSGGYREDYKRFEQDGRTGKTGYGFEQSVEVRRPQEGGYEQRTERRYDHPGGSYDSEIQTQGVTSSGRQYGHEEKHHGKKKNDSDDSDDDNDDDDWEKKERKRKKKEEKRLRKMREEEGEHGRRDDDRSSYGRQQESGGYGSSSQRPEPTSQYQRPAYGNERQEYGGNAGRRDDNESSGYGGGYGQRQEYGGRNEGYGGGREEYGGRNEQYGGRDEQSSYGGGGYEQPSSSAYGEDSYRQQPQRESYGGSGEGYEGDGSSGYGRQNDDYGYGRGNDEYER